MGRMRSLCNLPLVLLLAWHLDFTWAQHNMHLCGLQHRANLRKDTFARNTMQNSTFFGMMIHGSKIVNITFPVEIQAIKDLTPDFKKAARRLLDLDQPGKPPLNVFFPAISYCQGGWKVVVRVEDLTPPITSYLLVGAYSADWQRKIRHITLVGIGPIIHQKRSDGFEDPRLFTVGATTYLQVQTTSRNMTRVPMVFDFHSTRLHAPKFEQQQLNKVEKNWSPLPIPDGTLHYLYDLEPLTLVQCKDLRGCKLTWHDKVCRGTTAFPCAAAANQTVKRPDDVLIHPLRGGSPYIRWQASDYYISMAHVRYSEPADKQWVRQKLRPFTVPKVLIGFFRMMLVVYNHAAKEVVFMSQPLHITREVLAKSGCESDLLQLPVGLVAADGGTPIVSLSCNDNRAVVLAFWGLEKVVEQVVAADLEARGGAAGNAVADGAGPRPSLVELMNEMRLNTIRIDGTVVVDGETGTEKVLKYWGVPKAGGAGATPAAEAGKGLQAKTPEVQDNEAR